MKYCKMGGKIKFTDLDVPGLLIMKKQCKYK